MRATLLALSLGALALAHEGHHGFPTSEFNSTVIHSNMSAPAMHSHPAGGHEHGHGKPLEVFNETQVLQGHAPDPLSYIAYDLFGDRQGFKSGWGDDRFDIVLYNGNSHGWLMLWHVISMIFAFFFALPTSIALRSAKHPYQPAAHATFIGSLVFGWAVAAAYRKVTPDLYVGSTHGSLGNWLIVIVLVISALEYVPRSVSFSRRFLAHVQRISERGGKITREQFWEAVKIGRGEREEGYEAVRLLDDHEKQIVFEAGDWANEMTSRSGASSPGHNSLKHVLPSRRTHLRQLSIQSEVSATSTLRNVSPTSPHSLEDLPEEEAELYQELQQHQEAVSARPKGFYSRLYHSKVLHVLHFIWERTLVVLGYSSLISGTVVYTGVCRDAYLNGCLAHLIKGSIFFLYGVLTFARYLGAFSQLGWAWNALPIDSTSNPLSAELVESFVIFLYGATNTWMERFGAEPGSPYTAKQIQHISIAVMYFFGGAIGIALELGRRQAANKFNPVMEGDVQPYRASYNPFTALCISITGIAMAAHGQTYVFQVQVHMLWGQLLGFYGLARCFTYFFLWLNPPRSTEPSRPPSEALASFLLASGGLAFISSTEQIGFWAMRTGRDDIMMFANVIVALCFFCFTWLFGMLAFSRWATNSVEARARKQAKPQLHVQFTASPRASGSSPPSTRVSHSHEEYELGPYGKVKAAHV